MFTAGAEIGSGAGEGRWVAKPVRGVHGRGVTFHDDAREFTGAVKIDEDPVVADDGTRLIQHRVGGDEADLKVYVANGRCFSGEKRFTAESYATDEISPINLSPETEGVILATGEALGLTCYGVDLRFDEDGPKIIDANPFPGYRGFPEAVESLRAEIGRALGAAQG